MGMQLPHDIVAIARTTGPMATVYLDVTRSVEQAQQAIDLRWRGLRADLAAAGAPESTLAAIDSVIGRHDVPAEHGGHGQVVVAAGERVLFDHPLPHPPRRDEARWSPLPHLLPYLAALEPAIAHVLVVADRTGADLTAVRSLDAAEHVAAGTRTHVTGSEQHPIHKASVRDWSEQHFQQRVENSWAANARDVADAVAKQVADIHARAVVLQGDARALALLRTDLPHVLHPDVAVLAAEDGDVAGALLRLSWRERRAVLEHLQQNIGRGQYAVAGAREVLQAARRAQVDTLVLSDDPSSTLSAWVGPEPLQVALQRADLLAMGVQEPQRDRYDAALLRALAGTGAAVVVTPNAHEYVHEGVAALLRYTDAATPDGG